MRRRLCTAAARDPADAAGWRGAHAHQRDDVAIVAVHALCAALVIAARLRLDIAEINHMAEQLALVGLRREMPDIAAEPDINPRQIVERPALARQPAEQQKAGAGAQPLGQASKKSAERRQRKMLRSDLGKIGVAERAEVA
jgi:hypothetical protein